MEDRQRVSLEISRNPRQPASENANQKSINATQAVASDLAVSLAAVVTVSPEKHQNKYSHKTAVGVQPASLAVCESQNAAIASRSSI